MNVREFENYLSNDLIQIHVKADDWEDAIRKVAEPLKNNGTINEGYIDSMIGTVKEYGPYIVLCKGFALAHSEVSSDVNKVGYSVMTLDPPVCFGNEFNDPVKMIVCMAAVDSTSHLEMLKIIVRILSIEGIVDALADTCNIEDFKKALFEGLNESLDSKE